MFWQLTINARDPEAQARFWAFALRWSTTPPEQSDDPWWRHYRRRMAGDAGFRDRVFDPEGLRPPLWFQHAPETEEAPTPAPIHLDLYPTRRDDTLSRSRRIEIVEAMVTELVDAGGQLDRRQDDETSYFVVMRDPEGNTFCVS